MNQEKELMKAAESFSVTYDPEGQVVTIPSKAKKVMIENDNNHLFLRYHMKLTNPEVSIVIPSPNVGVIYKDGLSSGVLEAGPHKLYTEDEVKTKGILWFKKKAIKEEILVDVVVYNLSLTYRGFWGTHDPIPGRDPETGIPVDFKGRGQYDIRIADVVKFHTTLVGNDPNLTTEKLDERLKAFVMEEIRHEFSETIYRLHLGYLDITRNEKVVSQALQVIISDRLCDNYGLVVPNFAIERFFIDDDRRAEIEAEIKANKDKFEYKRDAKELAEELERLEDKQWEREKYLIGLRREDYAKYLEVIKLLGMSQANKPESSRKNHYCSKCGAEVEPDAAFCAKCGAQLKAVERVCPHCGKPVKAKGSFCPNCGKKL